MSALRRGALTATGWIGLTVLCGLPLLALIVQALSTRWFYPQLVPDEWTLGATRRVLGDPHTRSAFSSGLQVSALAALVSVLLAIPAARALVLGGIRRPRAWALWFLMPTALPPLALAMGLDVAFLRAGLGGSVWTVAVAHMVVTIPYAVLALTAALTRYDPVYERQAAVLGAGAPRILLHVFLPLAAPAILVSAVLAFVVSWGQYLLTLLPGGGAVTTPTVLVLAAAGGGDPALAAALGIATSVPPAIAVLLVVRRVDALGPHEGRR
ncbi:MAG: ABC transporter permease subunit [Thermoleophilia bacterium]